MHIIVLARYLSSSRGGMEISLLDVCQELHQRGHRLSLFYEEEGEQLEQYRKICSETREISSSKMNARIFNSAVINFLARATKLYSSKESVIYTNLYSIYTVGRAMTLPARAPLVCHLRLPAPDDLYCLQSNNLFRFIKHSILRSNADRYIAISNYVKSDWATKVGIKEDKIDVVYNGIDSEVFKPENNFFVLRKRWGIAESIKVVSYVGRLDATKGIETLIQAFALLQKSRPNTKLLIAGKYWEQDGKYKTFLEKLVADLELEEHLKFLGHVYDTPSLYQISDVTVLPSLWAEPFGRSIIESMACETPVVASRTGGITEIFIGDFQDMLFEPGNVQDLLKVLSNLLDWRTKTPLLGSQCRNHVLKNFRLSGAIDGIEKVLLKTIDRRLSKQVVGEAI